MTMLTDFLTVADLEKTADLQLFANQVVEGLRSGLHASPLKGQSTEFKQHRQYVPGDEIRRLDWKVFGKTDRFYIREFEEETNLHATLLLDRSGSMGYRGSGADHNKLEYATRLSACLAHLLVQQQDSVGLITFDERVRRIIPARSRPRHLRVLISEMAGAETGGESELSGLFLEVAPKLPRRGMLILISDCFCDASKLLRSLASLRHANHEVLIFQIWDRDELEFPFRGWTKFECLEKAGAEQLVDPAHLRTIYLDNLARFRDELERGCRRHRISLIPTVTDEPYADSLANYLIARRRTLRKR
ncbi:MAG: DUF58 domain-containing protein [Pirellulaceae bacterium]|jgi:uncharacterized protein (DUF58 family)|nr:DUF58 domain-containing protein [Pirellulaceae bacterium]MDP7020424.1 DUF58 domain-containing protein [Pirellulaceae bacterium]